MTNVTIEQLKRQILISESCKRGFMNCGMKVVELIEFHWSKLPKDFIDDITTMFDEENKR